jgi:hypothetical protein
LLVTGSAAYPPGIALHSKVQPTTIRIELARHIDISFIIMSSSLFV